MALQLGVVDPGRHRPGAADDGRAARIFTDRRSADNDRDRDLAFARAKRMRAGMAVISSDFSSTASWPSTSRLVAANAKTRCRAFWPFFRPWLRPRGLAVDGHEIGTAGPAFGHP